jgi:hypothetical protein
MSFYHGRGSGLHRFRLVLASFLEHDSLPFASVLPETRIEQLFAEEGASFAQEAECIYTPAVTLWAWLSQVLFKEEQRSCLAAVARVAVLMVALGRPACATNSGAYCRARAKLPEVVLRRLVEEVAAESEKTAPRKRLWHGRHVVLVDGTTVSMPDTPKNQKAYPQSRSQKPGLGFPIARLVVLLSLATGMVHGMALGPYAGKETGETSLLRELLDTIDPETILLADRYYCGYFLIALTLLGRRDVVTRLHQLRKTDFRKAKRLGKGDYLVEWTRPARGDRMDRATYAQIPASLSVRLVQVEVREPGFRVESFWVVTTLTDALEYPREEIAMLYRRRWLAELDLRAIKQTLGMDVLRGKSPAMVRKELWTCLLAYNLIRQAMLEAALAAGRAPRSLSFALALQTIAASFTLLACQRHAVRARLIAAQLANLTASTVGNRPDRVEPRAVKRRRDPIALLTKPRAEARADLLRAHPA